MDYLNRIRDEKYKSFDEIQFDYQINKLFHEAINFVSGAKLYGISIDTSNLEEVVAALYFYAQNKDYMVKINE